MLYSSTLTVNNRNVIFNEHLTALSVDSCLGKSIICELSHQTIINLLRKELEYEEEKVLHHNFVV